LGFFINNQYQLKNKFLPFIRFLLHFSQKFFIYSFETYNFDPSFKQKQIIKALNKSQTMKKQFILFIIIHLSINIFAQSGTISANIQTFEKAKLDQYFEVLETNSKFMGSIAILQNGKIQYSKAIGFSDLENLSKTTENSKFRIGSISKTFTATLVLKAVEEKKIELSDRLSKFYPNIPNADKITVENMLYHRSGLHSFTDDSDYLTYNTKPKTEQELIELIAKGKSEFEPGSKFAYSNSNYILLSFILQNIYKKPFAQILKEKITTPLGLRNTYFGAKINAKNDEVFSYLFEKKWIKETETDTSIPMGAGAIVSTASDLAIFGEALFSEKIISKNSLQQMKTLKDNYGMGIFPLPFSKKTGFGHTGAIDGFSSMFTYFPDSLVCFVMLSNGTNYNNKDIARTVLKAAFGKPFDIPAFRTFEPTIDDLDSYLGTYSSKDLPLKLSITKESNKLIAQATGQQPLLLDATEKHIFSFDKAGIILEFEPTKKTVLLKQGGGKFLFTKE
jgi:D-alanyl-D-alanine carboxypeptidase